MLNLQTIHNGCQRITGAAGNAVFVVRDTGGWELFARGRPHSTPLRVGTAPSMREALSEAKSCAEKITKAQVEDSE